MNVNTWQDSLGHWHATINDGDNTLAELPATGYGYDTQEQAEQAANAFIRSRERRGVDMAGGGVRG